MVVQTRPGRDPHEVSQVRKRTLPAQRSAVLCFFPETASRLACAACSPPSWAGPALLRYYLRLRSASRRLRPCDLYLKTRPVSVGRFATGRPRAGREEKKAPRGAERAVLHREASVRVRLGRRAELCRVQGRCLADQGRWRAARPVVRRCEAEGGAAWLGGLIIRTPRPRGGGNKGSVT